MTTFKLQKIDEFKYFENRQKPIHIEEDESRDSSSDDDQTEETNNNDIRYCPNLIQSKHSPMESQYIFETHPDSERRSECLMN